MTGSGENHVRVAGELLDDLLSLQVPDVDQAVLAAGDDPLAAGDGEVGEDAILFVLVSRVGLQTLALSQSRALLSSYCYWPVLLPWSSPTASECCPGWLPGCTSR